MDTETTTVTVPDTPAAVTQELRGFGFLDDQLGRLAYELLSQTGRVRLRRKRRYYPEKPDPHGPKYRYRIDELLLVRETR